MKISVCRALAVFVCVWGALPVHGAAAQSPARLWGADAGLGFGSYSERLRMQVDGATYDSTRTEVRPQGCLGVWHVLREMDDIMAIHGRASLVFGPTWQSGHWQVGLREDVMIARDLAPWLTAQMGLGGGAVVDTSMYRRSFLEIGLPLSLTVFHRFAITYRPYWAIPLSSERQVVFGGVRELQPNPGIVPFEFDVRVRWNGLSW